MRPTHSSVASAYPAIAAISRGFARIVPALALAPLLAALLSAAIVARAAEIEGVRVPPSTRLAADGPELVLNGAGLRTKAFFRVYVAGLYLQEKRATPKEVLALPGAKRISMTLLRDLTARQLTEALTEGIQDNHTPAEIEALKTRIDELAALMGAIGAAKAGAVITLDYLPASGTRITLNGEPRGKPITGDDFYRALLRIWLGDDPVDRALKRALLGQPG